MFLVSCLCFPLLVFRAFFFVFLCFFSLFLFALLAFWRLRFKKNAQKREGKKWRYEWTHCVQMKTEKKRIKGEKPSRGRGLPKLKRKEKEKEKRKKGDGGALYMAPIPRTLLSFHKVGFDLWRCVRGVWWGGGVFVLFLFGV